MTKRRSGPWQRSFRLQQAGRDGKTLLYFAVDESLGGPQLVKAVEIPALVRRGSNYTNGEIASFALAVSVSGESGVARALDAVGNPTHAAEGRADIFGIGN